MQDYVSQFLSAALPVKAEKPRLQNWPFWRNAFSAFFFDRAPVFRKAAPEEEDVLEKDSGKGGAFYFRSCLPGDPNLQRAQSRNLINESLSDFAS